MRLNGQPGPVVDGVVDQVGKVRCTPGQWGAFTGFMQRCDAFRFKFHIWLKDPEDYSFGEVEACIPNPSLKVT